MRLRAFAAQLTRLSGLNSLRLLFGSPYRILMYHRVVNPEDLPYPIQAGMYVRPETFEMHCEILKQDFDVVPLQELLAKIDSPLPKGTVAITFDDGWIDNYTFAYPILKKLNLPATIFLPTAYIGTGRFFWTDLAAIYLKERASGLKMEALEELLFKAASDPLETLLKRLFALPRRNRLELIQKLEFTLAAASTLTKYNSSFFTWENAKEMEESGLITFANHSHSHSLFGELTSEEVTREVVAAKEALEKKLVSALSNVVAYPGGSVQTLPEQFTGIHNHPKHQLGRMGVHQDISCSTAEFLFRVVFQR